MQIQERQRLEALFRRVDELEREVSALKAKRRPGRPKKVQTDE